MGELGSAENTTTVFASTFVLLYLHSTKLTISIFLQRKKLFAHKSLPITLNQIVERNVQKLR